MKPAYVSIALKSAGIALVVWGIIGGMMGWYEGVAYNNSLEEFQNYDKAYISFCDALYLTAAGRGYQVKSTVEYSSAKSIGQYILDRHRHGVSVLTVLKMNKELIAEAEIHPSLGIPGPIASMEKNQQWQRFIKSPSNTAKLIAVISGTMKPPSLYEINKKALLEPIQIKELHSSQFYGILYLLIWQFIASFCWVLDDAIHDRTWFRFPLLSLTTLFLLLIMPGGAPIIALSIVRSKGYIRDAIHEWWVARGVKSHAIASISNYDIDESRVVLERLKERQ